MLQEYGANKGVGENPLNGNGVARYENTGLRNGLFLRESASGNFDIIILVIGLKGEQKMKEYYNVSH